MAALIRRSSERLVLNAGALFECQWPGRPRNADFKGAHVKVGHQTRINASGRKDIRGKSLCQSQCANQVEPEGDG